MIENALGQQLAGHGDVLALLSALEAGQCTLGEAGIEVMFHLSSQFGEQPEGCPQFRIDALCTSVFASPGVLRL